MPMVRVISFNKLLEYYDTLLESGDPFWVAKAKHVLDAQAPYPELRDGFTDSSLLKKHKAVISIMLEDSFSSILGKNEIKAASLPYENLIFNTSPRFKKIIADAGSDFKLAIRNQQEDIDYILASVVVLNFYYGFKLDFSRPYFYDIPDASGVMRHYRILYNADFLEIKPTDKSQGIDSRRCG